ncbi:hypothetical protein E2C01_024883 [Portunus trituberculatus]|uniref:Uncharacterized protein n=1 Tax=Portunus trituberculatus TaxID=210409 RepID=A0A5B7EE21_PORTR|nr:hypothetical protein [Portunus trituberculatus]
MTRLTATQPFTSTPEERMTRRGRAVARRARCYHDQASARNIGTICRAAHLETGVGVGLTRWCHLGRAGNTQMTGDVSSAMMTSAWHG